MEDLAGAGAVIDVLRRFVDVELRGDTSLAERLFTDNRDIAQLLRTSQGGQNILAARFNPDIEFASR